MTILILLELVARFFGDGQVCVLWQVTDLRQTWGRNAGPSDPRVDVPIRRGIMVEMSRAGGCRMRLRVSGGLLRVLMWMMDRNWGGRVLMVLR